MDEQPNKTIGTDPGSNSGTINEPVNRGRANGRSTTGKRAKRSKTKTSQPAQPEKENILSEDNSSGFLSEDEINLVLNDFPSADTTPIPQSENLQELTSAGILLTLIDGMVQMLWGTKCGMTKDERKMLEDPLQRILARFPVSQVAAIGPYVDPLLLLMGLISWGSRISRIRRNETTPIPEQNNVSPDKLTPLKTEKEIPIRENSPEIMNVPDNLHIVLGSDI